MQDIYSNSIGRFEQAHKESFPVALKEIKNGRKESHWMWYIFPQVQGLGFSPMAEEYAIKDREEMMNYLKSSELYGNMIEICKSLLNIESSNASEIMGYPDDLKLKSSMTLFYLEDNENPLFKKVLDKFFNGELCDFTVNVIKAWNEQETSVSEQEITIPKEKRKPRTVVKGLIEHNERMLITAAKPVDQERILYEICRKISNGEKIMGYTAVRSKVMAFSYEKEKRHLAVGIYTFNKRYITFETYTIEEDLHDDDFAFILNEIEDENPDLVVFFPELTEALVCNKHIKKYVIDSIEQPIIFVAKDRYPSTIYDCCDTAIKMKHSGYNNLYYYKVFTPVVLKSKKPIFPPKAKPNIKVEFKRRFSDFDFIRS